MSAAAALDAYVAASGEAWKTFMNYREGRATDRQVCEANKAESNALAALQLSIDALEGGDS